MLIRDLHGGSLIGHRGQEDKIVAMCVKEFTGAFEEIVTRCVQGVVFVRLLKDSQNTSLYMQKIVERV